MKNKLSFPNNGQQVVTNLPLSLLLGSNNLKVARVQGRLLGRVGATLLGDFRPSASSSLVLSGRRGVALINDALVRQFTPAKELLGEMARVERAGGGMNGLGNEFGVSREAEKR